MITARYHREIPQRYRLEASECGKCKKAYLPPRKICPACKGTTMNPISLGPKGTLKTFTVIQVGAEAFSNETPFVVGIVELDRGVKLTMQVDRPGGSELAIGQKVNVVFRRIRADGKAGVICYGYKAVAADDSTKN
jgi:uncharacterized OB-fold protein